MLCVNLDYCVDLCASVMFVDWCTSFVPKWIVCVFTHIDLSEINDVLFWFYVVGLLCVVCQSVGLWFIHVLYWLCVVFVVDDVGLCVLLNCFCVALCLWMCSFDYVFICSVFGNGGGCRCVCCYVCCCDSL